MKKLLTFFLVALLAFGVGWAETAGFSLASPSGNTPPIAANSSNLTTTITGSAGETWNVAIAGTLSSSSYQGRTGARYWQMGKSGSSITSATFSTSGISGTISSIVVNCANASGAGGSVSVTVGGNNYGNSSSMPVWSNNVGGNVTFNGNASGEIVVTMVPQSGKACYIQSITVTYTSGSTPEPDPTIFHKVTSTSDLVAGQKYIIVYENGTTSVALGALNSSNVFDGVAGLTVTNNHQIDISGHSDVQVLTLEQAGSTSTRWALKTASGYIYGNNSATFAYESGSTTGGAQWTISENGIVTNSLNTDRSIRYYSNNSTFRHLTSTMGDAAYLYVEGEAAPMPVAEAPTFDPVSGGTFYGSLDVTISSATSGATIYYTTDGSEPTTSSNSVASGGTVTINSSCTIKAIAVAQDYDNSPVAEASYTKETLPMPTFSPVGGTYDIGQSIQVSISAVDGAAIYYTLDGTDPVPSRTAYTGPITISETTTLKAISVYNGETSAVATAEYVFAAPASTCEATIDFDNTATATLPGTGYHVSAGSDYVTGSSSSTAFEEADGIRLGSGSATGSLTLTLASEYNKVKKVVINAKRYQSDEGVVVNVTTSNGETRSADIANDNSFADYTFDNFNGNPVNTITISNSATRKRVHIKSVTIYYECAPVATLTATPNPLNINDTNEAGGKIGTILVSGANLGNDNVGMTFSQNHSTNFSSNPGYFSHNGTVTDYPVAITYTGQALSATGIVYPANNIVSTSVNITTCTRVPSM